MADGELWATLYYCMSEWVAPNDFSELTAFKKEMLIQLNELKIDTSLISSRE